MLANVYDAGPTLSQHRLNYFVYWVPPSEKEVGGPLLYHIVCLPSVSETLSSPSPPYTILFLPVSGFSPPPTPAIRLFLTRISLVGALPPLADNLGIFCTSIAGGKRPRVHPGKVKQITEPRKPGADHVWLNAGPVPGMVARHCHSTGTGRDHKRLIRLLVKSSNIPWCIVQEEDGTRDEARSIMYWTRGE